MLRKMVLTQMQAKSSLEASFFQQEFLPERFCGTVCLLMGHPVLQNTCKKKIQNLKYRPEKIVKISVADLAAELLCV